MDYKPGRIVFSRAGRDKGKFMAIVGSGEGYILVADGKERPLERPKKKNRLHISLTNFYIPEDELLFNNRLKHALRTFNEPKGKDDTRGR